MAESVSCVLPALDDFELLSRCLPPLVEECDRRGVADEILIVDDSGRDRIGPWIAQHYPRAGIRVVSHERNVGFARALGSGVSRASHELVFCMNTDVVPRAGFLTPLVAHFADESVFSVAPRVLLDGAEECVESLFRIDWEAGFLRVAQPGLGSGASTPEACAVPFAIGGACLLRRPHFDRIGGFDPLFEPFYLEDLDLGWRAWRAGLRNVYEPASIVEHHHRGTIGRVAAEPLVRAAIEKNRLLFVWKHLDDPGLWREHWCALYARVLESVASGNGDELAWILLALEQWSEIERDTQGPSEARGAAATFEAIARATRPRS